MDGWMDRCGIDVTVDTAFIHQEGCSALCLSVCVCQDFAFFAESVPGLFVLLGQGDGEGVAGQPCTSVTVHNPKFAIDERVLDLGAALHPYLALSAIDRLRRNDTDAAHAIKTEP